MDDVGHGTHVAGIAAGKGRDKNNNSIYCEYNEGEICGVAPDATIYAYKVLNSYGSGSSDGIIAAIERSIDLNENGIPCENEDDYLDIISLSLGGWGNPDDPMSKAIDNAAECTVPVVAAGNFGIYGEVTIDNPGNSRKAITVGAVYKEDYQEFLFECVPNEDTYCGRCSSDGKILCDHFGDGNPIKNQITSFSSKGPVYWKDYNNIKRGLVKPDIVAPGAYICAARYDTIFPEGENPYYKPCLDDKHVEFAGTSMATPMVSGAVALLKQKNPDRTPNEIKMVLRNTADGVGKPINAEGHGRIDILKAVDFIGKPPIAEIETITETNSKITDIIGSAYGDDFESYKLYYGKGENPKEWV